VLLGETGVSKEQVNFEQVARDVCNQVGYNKLEAGLDCNTMNVILNIQAQSGEIANAVHTNKDEKDFGAGD
jgi:S-adenosylmethionine synthetase